ncbi:MAG: hypothetical protein IKL53_02230 [Lachnospiraceae bacterium]|nr:hypothetical protein [Lachnospiraceae bacterium]
MDFIVYLILIGLIGFGRVTQTREVSDSVGIVDNGITTTIDCELPIAQNLAMVKEPDAYTLILEELGLKKC